jgi:glycosyltransferase involved in cell wall biosynthesis
MEVSFIIPTANRAALLQKTLLSIVQILPAGSDAEIIIVDNGSTDKTAETCSTIQAEFPKHAIRYIYDPMPGMLTGRHRGAMEARGDILSYLDDDVILGRKWLEGLRDSFSSENVALVGGPSLPKYEVEPPSWLEGMWEHYEGGCYCGHLSLFDQGPAKIQCDPGNVWGLNYSIRKSALYDCGGFHPDCIPKSLQRYQGDGESGLSAKLKQSRLSAVYHPDVSVTHVIPASRMTVGAFGSRAFYQGVCDSYSQRRRDGKPEINSHVIEEHAEISKNPTSEELGQLMAVEQQKGFAYHQNEVRNDEALLAWVLKPDYFDYSLPDGWESYQAAR